MYVSVFAVHVSIVVSSEPIQFGTQGRTHKAMCVVEALSANKSENSLGGVLQIS
jgi:hypothetical protein